MASQAQLFEVSERPRDQQLLIVNFMRHPEPPSRLKPGTKLPKPASDPACRDGPEPALSTKQRNGAPVEAKAGTGAGASPSTSINKNTSGKSESRSPGADRVIPKGFLLNVRCPTEERLGVRVDITSLKDHVNYVYSLMDLLTAINQKYSKSAKPKTCAVKYQKATDPNGNVVRRKVLEFSPYPSPIINLVRDARTLLYHAINSNCLILGSERFGNQSRNLYFLPADRVAALMAELDSVNRKLEEAQKRAAEFETSEDARKVERYLSSVGGVKLKAEIGRASVNPIPFSLSREFVSEFVEEIKSTLKEVDEERAKALARLQEEVEEQRKKMLQELETSLKSKVMAAIDALESAIRCGRGSKELTDAVESAANLAASMNFGIAAGLKEAAQALKKKDPPAEAARRLVISVGAGDLNDLKSKMERDPLLTLTAG